INRFEALREPLKEFESNAGTDGKQESLPKRLFSNFKHWAFSRERVDWLHHQMAATWADGGRQSEPTIVNQLRTHTDEAPAKYNMIVTGTWVRIGRLEGRNKAIDWLLAKHVLLSNYSEDVRFAGEIWKDADGVIHINRNSGTYKPSAERAEA